MTDPSCGSSSPNWATLISNHMEPDTIPMQPDNVTIWRSEAGPPLETAQEFPLLRESSSTASATPTTPTTTTNYHHISPYASVVHPVYPYASHLLALEQAAQINLQPLWMPPSRSTQEAIFGNASSSANTESQTSQTLPECIESASYWPGRDCFLDVDQLIATVAAQGPLLPMPREYWREVLPVEKPVAKPVQMMHESLVNNDNGKTSVDQTQSSSGGWRPYSYAQLGAEAATIPTSTTTTATTATNTSDSDFPSFDEFAKQVSECSLSSSEYLATLRNLMIRAHNLMLPLLRGRFANMSQVQMAAYTTAILEVTPLHPSLFVPSNVSYPWTVSGGVFPPCHPHSLAPQHQISQPRSLLIHVGTQTDYHCWCMHTSIFPPPPLHMPSTPLSPPSTVAPPPLQPQPSYSARVSPNSAFHYGAPDGPRMMAPCNTTAPHSFWTHRPIVPMPAYPQAQELPQPHTSRYGYNVNTYSVPSRLGTVGSCRSQPTVTLSGAASETQIEEVTSSDGKEKGAEVSKQEQPNVAEKKSSEQKLDNHDADVEIVTRDQLQKYWQPSAHFSEQLLPTASGSDENSSNDSSESISSRMIDKQLNNIFLQPTGPVMPIMPMRHFLIPPNGQGHAAETPLTIYDNYAGAVQIMPNVNMNLNMSMNMNTIPNMPSDGMANIGIANPPQMLSMGSFKNTPGLLTAFDLPDGSELDEDCATSSFASEPSTE